MSNDMSDIFNNIKSMMDNGKIPSDIQNIVNNLKSSNNENNETNNNASNNINNNQNNSSNSNSVNFDSNKISPEMISTLASLLGSNSSENNSNNSDNSQSGPSIDINTILKMKTIIESMNQKNDPRANLLYSLKPYLRENRKNKLDQYVNLLKMTKIADVMKNEKKENNSDA